MASLHNIDRKINWKPVCSILCSKADCRIVKKRKSQDKNETTAINYFIFH